MLMENKKEMVKYFKFAIVVILFVLVVTTLSAMEINRQVIAKIPDEITNNLLGMRIFKNFAFIMANNGQYVTINLDSREVNTYKLKSDKIIDFDIVVGKIIYIDDKGILNGHVFPKWPKGPYDSCRIEACDQGVILSGGNTAYFLAKNATKSFELPEFYFCLPIDNGFIWSLSLGKEKRWEASLYDCFGNKMSTVYKFSDLFKPSDIEIGPNGVDGELLISATEGNVRTLALIGNNGRMFWKINGPTKLCNRDVAFGPMDDLFVLEKNSNNDVVLSKWKFIVPEG